MKDSVYLNKAVQNDNVYGDVSIQDTATFFPDNPVINKFNQVVISNGKVVNFCSPTYGLLDNKDFFGRMEHELIDENLQYKVRSTNVDDRKFYVDYILDDDSKVIIVNDQKQKGVDDTLVPMIRLTNSYDGSTQTAGYLGFFRKVCHNGLHMATTKMEFKVRHTKGNMEIFIPNIEQLVKKFLDNEVYSIQDKIQKMKVHMIDERQLNKWIKDLAQQERVWVDNTEQNNLRKIEKAQEQGKSTSGLILPDHSKNVDTVREIILRDANNTGVEPNAWLVYSAFNEFIHSTTARTFETQKSTDTNIFKRVTDLVY